jgi:hypothetical protein
MFVRSIIAPITGLAAAAMIWSVTSVTVGMTRPAMSVTATMTRPAMSVTAVTMGRITASSAGGFVNLWAGGLRADVVPLGPEGGLGAVGDPDLREHAGEMGLDGFLADLQPARDQLVGKALGDEREHRRFSCAQS